ncbi:putative ATP-binding cassette subfamily A,member 1 [Leishmania major strain Friedlin]|uniref:Putative ATP-binding cassette subfamily A,member 1 n=1 Tax=Leishmania major TaxID=5664 RepID=E9ACA5_LEIMA|nr:putative ATP-binding cassette subfamily A,member 1 [Leishmania major strain Friedlin]CAG9567181.1 ATP-binding_cassette_subfamily_A_-_member_1_-_putative [Leishmania major strain Friedlin]CBZ11920.1 putative ATP-binding cassette subfamily A,member 1 [Leishmania major strain Friedlin]|eukprot:XP_003721636.1 putative ATP-binding cassette subfamily A,member 1 [Leishmania major strain Friedlin]
MSPPSAVASLSSGGQLPSAAPAAERPQEQSRAPPAATALISTSQAAHDPGAGAPGLSHFDVATPLLLEDRRFARRDAGICGTDSYTMHSDSTHSSNLTMSSAYADAEGHRNAGNAAVNRGGSSSRSMESDVGDFASEYYGSMPTSGLGHDGHGRADDVHTGNLRAPFDRSSALDYWDTVTTTSFSESHTLTTKHGGGADDLASPTAGGAGWTHKDSSTWLDQLGATISRDMIERRRRWGSVVLEIAIPLVCTVCVVALWAAFGVTSSPDYSSLASIGDKGYNFAAGRYLAELCYNETWFGERNYIDGLRPCSSLDAASLRSVICNTVGEEELPVKGLCYRQGGRGLADFLSGMRNGLARVMPLDDIIARQWMAKKLSLTDSAAMALLIGAGFFSHTRINAIASSGKLYFAPSENVPLDMLQYLSNNSRFFQYVYNDTFDTVEEAHRVIKSGERGPTWALVNIRQLDENGLDLSIEMASTALPALTGMVDKAYSGGGGYDRSNMYYTSGYPSLMDALVKYYLMSLYAAGATRAETGSVQALAERRAEQQQRQQAQAAADDSVDVVLDTHKLLNAVRAAREPVGSGTQFFTDVAELGNSSAAVTSQKASRILATSAALRAKTSFTIFLGSMPWVPFKTSQVLTSANTIIGFVIVMAFLYPVSQLTRRLVLEKERRVREATLIMGLRPVYFWCSWFLYSVALMLTISLFMTLLMCTTFLTKSDASCVLLVLVMFSLTCVPLSGLMATLYNTSHMAVLMTPLLYFAMSLLVFAIYSASPAVYLGLSIFSPTCFAIILQIMLARESGDGFATRIFLDPNDNPNTATLLGFLVLDFGVYLLLMFYLDAVLPKAVGVSKHPLYFILEPARHCRRRRAERAWQAEQRRRQAASATDGGSGAREAPQPPPTQRRRTHDPKEGTHGGSDGSCCTGYNVATDDADEDLCDGEDARDPNGVYEAETFTPEQLSVRIIGLRKCFEHGGRRFVAVRNFCWQLPNAGISVLLGHNGAGKSTLINMMTGMLYPDGGDCYIGGHSIRSDLARARHQIGFCPQHNILWPELTCREHLEFFARLKGLRGAALEDAVMYTLKEVDLVARQSDTTRVLSGGMKRKLSVAIAFVGGSSLVFLDEPTAGMDVAARRHTWRLLLRMSRSRSVLLTTHFMDEADLLGDRVAIMSRGQLKCAGSSLFLKSRLGIGYNITISVDELLRVRDLDVFLQQHVPQAERLTSSGGEVGYRLPAKHVERFPGLLSALDRVGPLIGIRGYAISPTTLEEVFLTIARDAAEDDKRRAKAESAAAVAAVADKKSCPPDLWHRSRYCCFCRGGGKGQSDHSSSDEFDWGDDDEDSHRNAGYLRDTSGVHPPEVSLYSALDRNISPMQHQSASLAAVSEQLPSCSSPTRTGYTGGCNRNNTRTSGSCTPSMSSLWLARPATSAASKAGDRASQEDVVGSGEPMQSTAEHAMTASSADVEHSLPRVPAAAAATTTVALTRAKDALPGDIIWNCEVAFSTAAVSLLQTEAMMRKRFCNMKRDRKALCFQMVCPAACILLAMLLNVAGTYTVRELRLNTSNYPYDTLWDTTGCAGYFNGSFSDVAASLARNQRTRDLRMTSLSDFYYFLQDEWFAHGKVGKYSGLACGDPVVAMLPSIDLNPVVLLTNYSAYHEFPIAMSNFYNLLLKEARGPSVSITASAGTLPSSFALASERSIKLLLTAIIILVPFTFLPANCVAWVVKERECRSRHLQDICGLRYLVYWFSNFVFDFTAYAVTMLLVVTILAVFRREEYIGVDTAGATFTLLSVFGFCSTTTAYFLQFFFATHSSAQSIVMATGFITGFLLVIIVFVLRLLPSTEATSHRLGWAFRIFPTYAVSEGIVNLALLSHFQSSDESLTAFSMQTIGWPCVYMAVEGPLFLILTLLIDHPHWRMRLLLRGGDAHRRRHGSHQHGEQPDASESTDDGVDEDSDVEDERVEVQRRIEAYREDLKRQENMYKVSDAADSASVEMAATSTAGGTGGDFSSFGAKLPIIDAVAVVGLRKQYDNGKVAVHDLSFGVVPGEVFGLLGTNGAGKTTTMSILCQEFYPTTGHVYVCGYDIVEESRDALRCIGYCPQFDATLDLLTVEEHLSVFAGIRGIVREQQKDVVRALLQLTGLREYRHTTSAALSGGNRRKLSVALSLIGGPPVVIFDEPSAGMDPVARREIWTSMQAIRHRCSIILCTHHLEEVEALADCVAIMVDGRLRCIGSKVHLRQKYGSGFEMTIRVQPPTTVDVSSSTAADARQRKRAAEAALEAIKARLIVFVASSFPSSQVSEVRGKRLVFTLPKNTNLPSVFECLQANRDALCISDYTVSQTSIEQIFMRVSGEVEKAEKVRTALSERRRDVENALRRKHEQLHLKREESSEGQRA